MVPALGTGPAWLPQKTRWPNPRVTGRKRARKGRAPPAGVARLERIQHDRVRPLAELVGGSLREHADEGLGTGCAHEHAAVALE